jgi:hypothetical protein
MTPEMLSEPRTPLSCTQHEPPDPFCSPGLYLGTLRHRRFHPRRHVFTYRVGMALLDVDRLDELCAASPFISRNRWNWASFDDRDHVGDPSRPLRERLAADAARAGAALPPGRIALLTNLRYLGYCFNPVSYYYCHESDGALSTVMAEVHNTFGERHTYWMTPDRHEPGRPLSWRFPKSFHVSPFLPMSCDYRFSFSPPGERLHVHVTEWQDRRFALDATLDLARRPWRPREILAFLARHPLMTAKVVAAIHWQALQLWLKRVPVFTHPKKLANTGRRS